MRPRTVKKVPSSCAQVDEERQVSYRRLSIQATCTYWPLQCRRRGQFFNARQRNAKLRKAARRQRPTRSRHDTLFIFFDRHGALRAGHELFGAPPGREHGTRVGATEMPGEKWRSGGGSRFRSAAQNLHACPINPRLSLRGQGGVLFHVRPTKKISPVRCANCVRVPGHCRPEMPGRKWRSGAVLDFGSRRKTSMRVPQLIRVCFTLLYRYCCVPVSGWYICVPFNLHKFVYGV